MNEIQTSEFSCKNCGAIVTKPVLPRRIRWGNLEGKFPATVKFNCPRCGWEFYEQGEGTIRRNDDK